MNKYIKKTFKMVPKIIKKYEIKKSNKNCPSPKKIYKVEGASQVFFFMGPNVHALMWDMSLDSVCIIFIYFLEKI